MTKEQAMAKFLDCDVDDLTEEKFDYYGLTVLSDHAIGTDEEADKACEEYIKQTAWAFNASFIISECGLDCSGEESLKTMQEKSCEGANDFILSLIEKTCGIGEFVDSAISAEGRGHFLSSYDGNENEEGNYYIYRIN